MKVTAYVDLPRQEVEVNIDGHDVVAAILGETEGYDPSVLIKRAMNNVGSFLKNLPDEEIRKLTPSVRATIRNFCLIQAERFAQDGYSKSITHWVLPVRPNSFVKESRYFESQGGLTEPWGIHWIPVSAGNIEHARAIADALLSGQVTCSGSIG